MSDDTPAQSAAEIEREIERTRKHLDRTLEALNDKLSPGQLLDEAAAIFGVKPGDATRAADTLGAVVRENPIPLAVIGASLGWLVLSAMSGPRRPARHDPQAGDAARQQDVSAYDIARPQSAADRAAGAPPHGRSAAYRRPASDPLSGNGGTAWGAGRYQAFADVSGPGYASAVSAGADAGRAATSHPNPSGPAASAGSREPAAGSGGASRLSEGGETVHHTREHVVETGRHALHRAREGYSHVDREVRENAGALRDQAEGLFQRQPLAVGALGVAFGALIALALPPTRREREVLGPARDRVMGEASELGGDLGERLKEAGQHAYEAVRDEAREAVERVVQAGTEVVREEADDLIGEGARTGRHGVAEGMAEAGAGSAAAARGSSGATGRNPNLGHETEAEAEKRISSGMSDTGKGKGGPAASRTSSDL